MITILMAQDRETQQWETVEATTLTVDQCRMILTKRHDLSGYLEDHYRAIKIIELEDSHQEGKVHGLRPIRIATYHFWGDQSAWDDRLVDDDEHWISIVNPSNPVHVSTVLRPEVLRANGAKTLMPMTGQGVDIMRHCDMRSLDEDLTRHYSWFSGREPHEFLWTTRQKDHRWLRKFVIGFARRLRANAIVWRIEPKETDPKDTVFGHQGLSVGVCCFLQDPRRNIIDHEVEQLLRMGR